MSARLEKEVLREWRARQSSERRAEDPAPALLENARWAAAEGLYDESLETLDRALELDPDSRDVLAWLRADPIPLRTPEPGDEFIDGAARLRPSAREILWARTDSADPALRDQLIRGLSDGKSPARRSAAAHGLRRLFPGEGLRELTSRAALDASEDVRREAARALGSAGTDRVCAPLVRALTSEHPSVRRNAAEALGTTGYITAVQPLIARLANLQGSSGDGRPPASHIFSGRQIAYLQDFDVEVANNASISDPQVGVLHEGSVLDVRVLSITRGSANAERAAIRRSLEMLTNVRAGNTSRAWLDWWQRNGEDWLSRTARERPSSPETGSADG